MMGKKASLLLLAPTAATPVPIAIRTDVDMDRFGVTVGADAAPAG
jgi:hypothetical protein